MDHRAGFEAALLANRYDSETRLVFSDWLEENGFDDEALEQRRMATPEWVEADKYLHAYAARMNDYDSPEDGFTRLINGLRSGELRSHGSDTLSGLYDLNDAEELKQYAEVWLRKEIDWNEFWFSCSC